MALLDFFRRFSKRPYYRAMTLAETLSWFPREASALRAEVSAFYARGEVCVGAFERGQLRAWIWVPLTLFSDECAADETGTIEEGRDIEEAQFYVLKAVSPLA